MMNLFELWYFLMCLFEFTIEFLFFASTISIKIVILFKICYHLLLWMYQQMWQNGYYKKSTFIFHLWMF
jgi:hypothetical protein